MFFEFPGLGREPDGTLIGQDPVAVMSDRPAYEELERAVSERSLEAFYRSLCAEVPGKSFGPCQQRHVARIVAPDTSMYSALVKH